MPFRRWLTVGEVTCTTAPWNQQVPTLIAG